MGNTQKTYTNYGNLRIGASQIDDCEFSEELSAPMGPYTTGTEYGGTIYSVSDFADARG